MSYFFYTISATTAQAGNDLLFSESFWNKVLSEYGLLGVVLVGLLVIIVSFIKYSSKKLDNEEKKGEREDGIRDTVSEMSGLLEQIKREADSHQSTLDLKILEIKKDSASTLSEISRLNITIEKDTAETRREFSDVKSQLRDIYRDIYRERR